jgi:hypothetical protein
MCGRLTRITLITLAQSFGPAVEQWSKQLKWSHKHGKGAYFDQLLLLLSVSIAWIAWAAWLVSSPLSFFIKWLFSHAFSSPLSAAPPTRLESVIL